MEGDTLVSLRWAFGLAYALDSIEGVKSGILFQLATFEDQHTGPGPEELASNRQAGWTAANYDKVRIEYGIRTKLPEIIDLQAPYSDRLNPQNRINTEETSEQARKNKP
jgi:hypothetical protein